MKPTHGQINWKHIGHNYFYTILYEDIKSSYRNFYERDDTLIPLRSSKVGSCFEFDQLATGQIKNKYIVLRISKNGKHDSFQKKLFVLFF